MRHLDGKTGEPFEIAEITNPRWPAAQLQPADVVHVEGTDADPGMHAAVVEVATAAHLAGLPAAPFIATVRHCYRPPRSNAGELAALGLMLLAVAGCAWLVLTATGCSPAAQAASRTAWSSCTAKGAPELLGSTLQRAERAAAELEWRSALAGVAADVGQWQLRCALEALMATWRTEDARASSSVRLSVSSLTVGCPSGSCDVQGPEAGDPREVLRYRAQTWLAEHPSSSWQVSQ